MIGGIDIQIPTTCGASSLEFATRAIQQRWPSAVFENGLTGDRYEHFDEIPFGETTELFIYRDRAAADLWEAEGAVPSAFNTMIHLVADGDMLTLVVDERDAAMEEIIAAVSSGIRDQMFNHKAMFTTNGSSVRDATGGAEPNQTKGPGTTGIDP
jgi:hypothetical protein